MLVRRVAVTTLARCLAALLLATAAAAMVSHAQAQSGPSWAPWNKPDQPKKKDPPKDAAKEQPKDPAPAAKPKVATEPKPNVPKAEGQKGSADAAADLAFWNSVKDRGRPDEFRAYLKAFPEGRFTELARLRLAEAEAAQVTGTNASGAPDMNVVREIQERLYKLNYQITRFDGSVDETTDRAIKAWQVKHEFAPSGTLTAEQLRVLRGITPASIWGAIAHPVVGTAAVVFGKGSRQEAESQALAECKSKNGVACKVFAAPTSECVAVSNYRGKGLDGREYVTHFYSRAPTTSNATVKVLALCNIHPLRGTNRCVMVGAACSNSAVTGKELNKGPPPAPATKPKAKEQET